MNYWPGFVDALSTLILSIIFLLTVFMVAQFFLSQEVVGKDTALSRLNAEISRLSQLLSLEQTGKANLEDQVAQLRLRKDTMDPARYDQELERLLTDLALKTKAIRDLEGRK